MYVALLYPAAEGIQTIECIQPGRGNGNEQHVVSSHWAYAQTCIIPDVLTYTIQEFTSTCIYVQHLFEHIVQLRGFWKSVLASQLVGVYLFGNTLGVSKYVLV